MENMEQPVEQTGSVEFGKFKDAESLLKAYANLESEFTKKSQRLATLEESNAKAIEENNRVNELNKRVDDFVTKFEAIRPFSSALKESLIKGEEGSLEEGALKILSNNYKPAEDYAKDSEFLKNYIYNNDTIKENIIKEYLSKVTQFSPIKVSNANSAISLTPPKQPTTIKEAGALARTIIKQK